MPETEPRLRAVGAEDPAPAPERDAWPPGPRRAVVALSIALLVALALLLWSRGQMNERIAALQAENARLAQQLAAEQATVAAQDRRLSQVKTHLRGVVDLLEEPIQP